MGGEAEAAEFFYEKVVRRGGKRWDKKT